MWQMCRLYVKKSNGGPAGVFLLKKKGKEEKAWQSQQWAQLRPLAEV